MLLRAFAAPQAAALLQDLQHVTARSPLRRMITRGGYRMSVAMSNCGTTGWITDEIGYRYDGRDPLTAASWPAMPASFSTLATCAAAAAGFPDFLPDACLISRYEPGARLSLHQDRDESDLESPIVSISLGLFSSAASADPNGQSASRSRMAMWWSGAVRHGCAFTASCRSATESILCSGVAGSTYRCARRASESRLRPTPARFPPSI
jgi:alkylated DNA repair protein (DNA oxidative demethylase)